MAKGFDFNLTRYLTGLLKRNLIFLLLVYNLFIIFTPGGKLY